MTQEEDANLLMDLSATLPLSLIPVDDDVAFQQIIEKMGEPCKIGGEDCICWDTRPWDERQGQLMCWCGAPEYRLS